MKKINQNNMNEKLQQLVKENTKRSFDPHFAERVISKLNTQNSFQTSVDQLLEQLVFQFRRMAFSVIMLLLLLVAYNAIDQGEITVASLLDMPQVSIEEALDPINNIAWSE